MYMASFNSTIERYRELLAEQNAGNLKLPNDNLDVGAFTAAGRYRLTDAVYTQLLHKLHGRYTEIPQDLRTDILAFFHDFAAESSAKADDPDWDRMLQEVDELRAVDADLQRPAVVAAEALRSK
jgi:hypothetical protein